MKITDVRTRVVEWRGRTVPLPPHFCTNPMDLLALPEASMRTFTFHGWLVVEAEQDPTVAPPRQNAERGLRTLQALAQRLFN